MASSVRFPHPPEDGKKKKKKQQQKGRSNTNMNKKIVTLNRKDKKKSKLWKRLEIGKKNREYFARISWSHNHKIVT